jgi:hypothetical protein
MKRLIKLVFIMAGIATTAAWNLTQTKSEANLSDVALANVEALAIEESGGDSLKDAYKGTAYIYGSLVRVKEANTKCKMQYTESPKPDGSCF